MWPELLFSHTLVILSPPWWLGAVSSRARLRPTAALLPSAGGSDEGRLWWSCSAHRGPLLLPRPHETGRYPHAALCSAFTFTHSRKTRPRSMAASLQLSVGLKESEEHPAFSANIEFNIYVWYYFWHSAHSSQFQSRQCDIYRHKVIELCPGLTCSLAARSDICLKEVPSIADSLYNIQLLREFASEYLNKSFYLTTEDMLYSPLVLKVQQFTSSILQHLYWL